MLRSSEFLPDMFTAPGFSTIAHPSFTKTTDDDSLAHQDTLRTTNSLIISLAFAKLPGQCLRMEHSKMSILTAWENISFELGNMNLSTFAERLGIFSREASATVVRCINLRGPQEDRQPYKSPAPLSISETLKPQWTHRRHTSRKWTRPRRKR